MEVHTHSHSEHSGPRKKWHHYFWEFLMLFLAVTLGFFVENQREHYIENKRAKNFAASLIQDLKADTAYIQFIIHVKKWNESKLDTLLQVLSEKDNEAKETKLYYYASFLTFTLDFRANDATFQQLSHSGSLRYFEKREIYNSIAAYYTGYGYYREGADDMKPYYPQADQLIEKIFDAVQMSRLANEIGAVAIFDQIKFPDSPLKLRDNDPALLNSLYSKAFRFRALSEVNRKFGLDDLLNRAKTLLEILKKEYHLE